MAKDSKVSVSPKYKEKMINLLRGEREDALTLLKLGDGRYEKQQAVKELLSQNAAIKAAEEELEQAEKLVQVATQKVNAAILKVAKEKKIQVWDDDSPNEVRDKVINAYIEDNESESAKIRKKYRRWEAQVNSAKTEEAIEKVLKEAGLL